MRFEIGLMEGIKSKYTRRTTLTSSWLTFRLYVFFYKDPKPGITQLFSQYLLCIAEVLTISIHPCKTICANQFNDRS